MNEHTIVAVIPSFDVKCTGKELFALFKEIAEEYLKKDLPDIKADLKLSVSGAKDEDFGIYCCLDNHEKIDYPEGYSVRRNLKWELTFPLAMVKKVIIDKILEEKKILNGINVSTPVSNFYYARGILHEHSTMVAVTFDFKVLIEDSNDYK